MNVLSLFDGKSSGYTAMELAGIPVTNYYSAEIDKYAIQVSNAIHPNQVRLGDVTKWREWDIDWASIDYLFSGFPCQSWSVAGSRLGDKDERGMLFWVMLDIFKHVQQSNPKVKFLIENVKMKKEFEKYITHHTEQALGEVNKHLINASLLSAQNRQRYYWCNWGVQNPKDKGVVISDIEERSQNLEKYAVNKTPSREVMWGNGVNGKCPNLSKREKSWALTTKQDRWNNAGLFEYGDFCRYLTPRECFRLQTTPEHYIDKILNCGVSNTQLYKIAGNGWTDEVIAHILRSSI